MPSTTNMCSPQILMSSGEGQQRRRRAGGAWHSHAHEERLLGCQPWGRVFLHQCQGAEAKLVDGLVGVQGRKVGVDLTVVLGDVQAVGADVVTATESTCSQHSHRSSTTGLKSHRSEKPPVTPTQICPQRSQWILLPQPHIDRKTPNLRTKPSSTLTALQAKLDNY